MSERIYRTGLFWRLEGERVVPASAGGNIKTLMFDSRVNLVISTVFTGIDMAPWNCEAVLFETAVFYGQSILQMWRCSTHAMAMELHADGVRWAEQYLEAPSSTAVPTFRHADGACWNCSKPLDASEPTVAPDDIRPPEAGDFALCGYCGEVSVFDEKVAPRRPTPAELEEASSNVEIAKNIARARNALGEGIGEPEGSA